MNKQIQQANHRLSLYFWASIFALITLVGCSSDADESGSDSIENIVWQWVSVTNQSTGEITSVPDPENYNLIFRSDGVLEGLADCNSFTGTYTKNGDFKINIASITMAFCGEASLDQQYLDLLSQVVAGGPDGAGGLALENAGGEQRMLFKNGGEAPNP
jgi:heat shock protein HslJ